MHELLTCLNQQGVMIIVVLSQSSAVGAIEPSFDITYLADTVLLVRFETRGEVRRTVLVVKKRVGSHEGIMRELLSDNLGLQADPVLAGFENILSNHPVYTVSAPLLAPRPGGAGG